MRRLLIFALLVVACVATMGAGFRTGSRWGTGIGPGFAPMQRGGVWTVAKKCIEFDGVDDFAAAYNTAGMPLGNSARTVMLWVYDKSPTGGVSALVTYGAFTDSLGFYGPYLGAGSTIGMSAVNHGFTQPISRVSAWKHYAITVPNSGTYAQTKLFEDGVEVVSARTYSGADGAYTYNTSAGWLYIGTDWPANRFFFAGKMREIAIFNTELSQSTISQYISNGLSGTESGLVRLYRCDEGSGSILTDSVGGNNLSLYNGAQWVER